MAKIKKLDRHVADLIAAGEVVERPASAVKELIENSIDAGAGSVTVEIRRGGMEYIRVTDDGGGILPEDVETAFLRHATSKLYDSRGLEAIKTLGFRGEALAAISAVSHVELMKMCIRDSRHSVQCFLTAQYPVSVNFPAIAGDHYLFHLFEEKTAGITDCVGPVVIFYAVCSTYVAHHKAAGCLLYTSRCV